jgi:NADH:ubiquinone oxidoreductase subunit E
MVGEAPAPSELATADERAAVDLVLERYPAFERSLLLPLLQDVQQRQGVLTKGLIGYLGGRVRLPFAEVYGVATFYALLSTERAAPRLRLCGGVPCILAGAERIAAALNERTALSWDWFPCVGQCDRAPAALVGGEPVFHLASNDVSPFLGGANDARD